jgi:hypothetical protein
VEDFESSDDVLDDDPLGTSSVDRLASHNVVSEHQSEPRAEGAANLSHAIACLAAPTRRTQTAEVLRWQVL